MKKTVPVDIFGSCGDKQCLPKMSPQCLSQLAKEYRFILAFENSICRDYVTEKYFSALEYDIIPIVLGGANYAKIAPPNSYIDSLSFTSPRKLGYFLLYLAKHPEKYNTFFNWRKYYGFEYEHYACQICRKLHDTRLEKRVWSDIYSWWFQEANCSKWLKPGIK